MQQQVGTPLNVMTPEPLVRVTPMQPLCEWKWDFLAMGFYITTSTVCYFQVGTPPTSTTPNGIYCLRFLQKNCITF